MFDEVHADSEESGNMGDNNDEGAEVIIHNKASISEKCWSHLSNQLETMRTTLTM
jgi:hypothetical protein